MVSMLKNYIPVKRSVNILILLRNILVFLKKRKTFII